MLSKRRAASEKQRLANRANARRSTGPKTGAGKARASVNAVRHGLTAKRLVIAGEDHAQFERFCAELESQCAPTTEVARRLARQLAGILWRLRRVSSFEASIFSARAAEVTPEQTRTMEEFHREQMAEIAARYRTAESDDRGSVEPQIKVTEPQDPSQLFWRKIGVALTCDSLLLDALGNLSRHEGALLNLARTWQLLRSLSPHSTASKIVAVKRSRFKVALETQAKVNSCDCCNILAEKIVIGDEEPAQFESLRAELEAHYAPRTRMQRELIDYIAGLFWRLERLPALEAALIDVLRNKVAPDEIDSEAEQARREEFEKITAKLLRKFGYPVPKEPKKEEKGHSSTHSKKQEPLNTVAGLVLIQDSQGQDALGRLSRHETALTKGLSRASQLLTVLQSTEHASNDRDQTDAATSSPDEIPTQEFPRGDKAMP
jgi:hypothetical protein